MQDGSVNRLLTGHKNDPRGMGVSWVVRVDEEHTYMQTLTD